MAHDNLQPGVATPKIANEINAATRTLHTELNKQIIARLPLALPPHTSGPLLYTIGIQAFSQIYLAFEVAWDLHLTNAPPSPLSTALSELLSPKIRRSARHRADLKHLVPLVPHALGGPTLLTCPSPSDPPLADYITHIHGTIQAYPHKVVAYAWVMYMAIFSGGRWIRAQLHAAGDEFWHRDAGDKETGYSFLCFEGERDGEDVKARFKERLAGLEELLSPEQWADVVGEAGEVFRRSLALVEELDEVVLRALKPNGLRLKEGYPKRGKWQLQATAWSVGAMSSTLAKFAPASLPRAMIWVVLGLLSVVLALGSYPGRVHDRPPAG